MFKPLRKFWLLTSLIAIVLLLATSALPSLSLAWDYREPVYRVEPLDSSDTLRDRIDRGYCDDPWACSSNGSANPYPTATPVRVWSWG
jgi:hypothetical protein